MALPAAVLVAAVREFITGLSLDGRDAFHARVAANALAIVEREIEQRPDVAEAAALATLFRYPREGGDDGVGGAVSTLRAEVCAAIRDDSLDSTTPGLLAALIVANLARLAVDNPRYSTFLRRSAASAPRR